MISLKNTLEAIKTKLNAHDKALSVDYIVEQGTSGIWTYRKWNSGIAECWGRGTWTSDINSSWGTSTNQSTKLFPETTYPFAFKTAPCVSANAWNKDYTMMTAQHGGSKSESPVILAVRPAGLAVSSTITIEARIHAIGRWK